VENYEVNWSLRAVRELNAIGEYIARDRPLTADRITAAIEARVAKLAMFSNSGTVFRRRRTGVYREIGYKKYRIFYRVDDVAKKVLVATVWHGARRDPKSFD
jgi:plasmid stabilization system protein ParE